MAHRVVVLGAGTGGTLVANRLHRRHRGDLDITIVDQDGSHLYQPGLLFVPFGLAHARDLVRPRREQLLEGVDFRPVALRADLDGARTSAERVRAARARQRATLAGVPGPRRGARRRS